MSNVQVVYKYSLPLLGRVTQQIPQGAKIVHAEVPLLCGPKMWALVDPEQPKVSRTFQVVTTGDDVPAAWQYIRTFLDPPWVLHLFEEPQ